MHLLNYIIRRLILLLFVLLGVTILVFSIMMMIPPGMRVAAYVSHAKINESTIDALIKQYGLNDPAPIQYFRWLGNICRGNFGFSTTIDAPVLEGFKQFFPVTLELVLFAMPFIILVGIKLGVLGAIHKDKPIDHISRIFAIMGYSFPTFWLGLLLLMIFYGYFGIFPPGTLSPDAKNLLYSDAFTRYTGLLTIDGILNGRLDFTLDALYHIILPVLNLIILLTALIIRLMRSSMLDALGKDYIRTALAKGADKKTIYYKHARKNALLPVITISGTMFAGLMGGMVITETIFARPGLGRWTASAALQLDVPAIMFNVLFLGVIFVLINLVVDILYAVIDPRIQLQ